MRVCFEPLWPAGPNASVKELDEQAGGWQGGVRRCGDGLQLSQAGVPRTELVIPHIDDPYGSLRGDKLVVACAVMWLEQREEVDDWTPKGTKRGTSSAQGLPEALTE